MKDVVAYAAAFLAFLGLILAVRSIIRDGAARRIQPDGLQCS